MSTKSKLKKTERENAQLATRATVAESEKRSLEARNKELEIELGTLRATPPAPPPSPAAPPPPPATPALDRLREIEKHSPLLAADHAIVHAATIRAELAAKAAHAAGGGTPPAAPAAAPPPAPPVAPVAPPPPVRTYREVHRELRERDPYRAAAFILEHQAHLDAAVPQ